MTTVRTMQSNAALRMAMIVIALMTLGAERSIAETSPTPSSRLHGPAAPVAPSAPPRQAGGHHHSHHGPAQVPAAAPVDIPYAALWQAGMAEMHRDMAIGLSGVPELDFILGMIPHHRGAITMAEIALAQGRDPRVRVLADGILRDQRMEIEDMKDSTWRCKLAASWTEASGSARSHATTAGHSGNGHGSVRESGHGHHMDHGSHRPPYAQAWEEASRRMHDGMDQPLTGNADIDLLTGMIPHHEGAIAMASIAREHGTDACVTDFASEVIAAQTVEIAAMRALLRDLSAGRAAH